MSDEKKKVAAGISIPETMKRTGYTRRQLDGMIRRGKIQWRNLTGRVEIHPADVERMETAGWNNNPFNPEDAL